MFERKTPKVSIVIPSWFTPDQHGHNGQHETFWFAAECLQRLMAVTKRSDYELIIIDNGSTLSVSDLEESEIDPNKLPAYWEAADVLIRNKKNLGFAPSCNQGFALARGKYIICMNNDILVWENWIESMIEPFENELLSPPVGIVMPALVKETRDPEEALKMKKIDLSRNYDQLGIQAEFGSLWVAKKELLRKVAELRDGYQVFDEDFLCGMGEDRLLWQEIRKLGYETYRTHKTRCYHRGNMTISKIKDRKKYTEENRKKLEEKKKKLWSNEE